MDYKKHFKFSMLTKKPKSKLSIALLVISTSLPLPSLAVDTDTVPGGVRAFVYKHVDADVIGNYSSKGTEQNFNVEETLTATLIKDVSPAVSQAYNELYSIDPHLALSLNMGTVSVAPKIKVSADAFALAWGLSDKLMVVGAIPTMKAYVSLNGGYYANTSIENTIAALQNYINNANIDPIARGKAEALMNALKNGVPTPKGDYLQGVIVNDYGYKPIGNWAANGVGDALLFTMAKVVQTEQYTQALKVGNAFPTGRKDDPDNLLDIPFGKGYNQTFIGSIHDLSVIKDKLTLTAAAQFQYNWANDRTFRLAPSRSFPLTSDKEMINYKPGNEYTLEGQISSKFFRSVGVNTSYQYKQKYADKIHGKNLSYDYGILSDKTDSNAHTATFTITYSTVDLFLRKKFPIPFKLGAGISRILRGANTERLNISTLDFEMYF